MKKTAILALFVAVATSASAATIRWGFGGAVYVAESATATAVASTSFSGTVPYSLALVYIGQEQDTFDISTLTANSIVTDETSGKAATMTYSVATTGKNAGQWNPSTTTASTTAYNDKASFAVVLYNADKGSFDYIYSGTTSVGSAYNTTVTVSDMSARGSATIYGAHTSTGASSTGVVVVPEPSVALMSLLGIGMLLKRRRA